MQLCPTSSLTHTESTPLGHPVAEQSDKAIQLKQTSIEIAGLFLRNIPTTFPIKPDKCGLPVAIIEKGIIIQHTSDKLNDNQIPSDPTFFCSKGASCYGKKVLYFKTTRPLKLMMGGGQDIVSPVVKIGRIHCVRNYNWDDRSAHENSSYQYQELYNKLMQKCVVQIKNDQSNPLFRDYFRLKGGCDGCALFNLTYACDGWACPGNSELPFHEIMLNRPHEVLELVDESGVRLDSQIAGPCPPELMDYTKNRREWFYKYFQNGASF